MRYSIIIEPDHVTLNNQPLPMPTNMDGGLLTALYRQYVKDYPQFFKMDGLSKLAFIASELLLQSTGEERFVDRDDRAVILFGVTGSLATDKLYQQTISKDNYYPSPSLFVRTLPNIAVSEIAIRNHYHGETMFLQIYEDQECLDIIKKMVHAIPDVKDVLYGGVDYTNENDFIASMLLINKE